MFKKVLFSVFGMMLTTSLLASELTIYAYKHYRLKGKLAPLFEEKTGIKVKTVFGGAGAIMKQLKEEGESSPADVLLMADVGRLHQAKEQGLIQAVQSEKLLTKIPAKYRDPDKMWFGFSKRARVLYYNPSVFIPNKIHTYEDLSMPQWKGKIRIRPANNIYNQSFLAAMIAHKGLEATEEWVKGFAKNLAQNPPKGDDRTQAIAVANNGKLLAIANQYYMGKMLNNKKVPAQQEAAKKLKMKFLRFQKGGTHINLSAAAVTQSADNVAHAIRFIEFLLEAPAQRLMVEINYEYPMLQSVQLSPLMQSWGTLTGDDISSHLLGKFQPEAMKILQQSNWQ